MLSIHTIKETQLEGLAMSVGENAVNKHANVVCRKVVSEQAGTYGCYVAVHVVIKDVVDGFNFSAYSHKK